MARRVGDIIAAAYCYVDQLGIRPHQLVIIVSSTNTHRPIQDAILGAVLSRGADPVLLMMKHRNPLSIEAPKAVVDCCCKADVVIDLQPLNWAYQDSRNTVIREVTARGGRYKDLYALEEDVDHFCELLPDPVVQARTERMVRIVDSVSMFRVQSDDGTNLVVLRGDVNERPSFAPQGQVAFSPPEDGVNGTIMYKGGIRVLGPTLIKLMVYEPVRLQVENGQLVDIARNTEAGIFLDDWLRSMRHPGAYQFAHINFGVDHRVKLHRLDNLSVHYNFGGILIAFGTNYTARFVAGERAVRVRSHVDAQLVGQSLWADGTQILDHGEFTPESQVLNRDVSEREIGTWGS